MNGNSHANKIADKLEVNLFEKMFKCMKYKYEDIIKVFNLYSEVSLRYQLLFRE